MTHGIAFAGNPSLSMAYLTTIPNLSQSSLSSPLLLSFSAKTVGEAYTPSSNNQNPRLETDFLHNLFCEL